jgi:hypothetical protein
MAASDVVRGISKFEIGGSLSQRERLLEKCRAGARPTFTYHLPGVTNSTPLSHLAGFALGACAMHRARRPI